MKLKMWLTLTAVVVIAIALPGLFTSREVNSSIGINAPAETVWKVLSDFPHYGEWNPFITRISGATSPGSRLAVTIRPAIGGEMEFNLLLQSTTPPHEMIWLGQTLMPKLLDGRHYLRIDPIDADHSRFSQGERYSGLLLFFSWPVIRWSVNRSFAQMNEALRNRSAHKHSTHSPQ